MNLLSDPWVPVRHDKTFRHVTYRDVLCCDNDWQISLPRDDMELAVLQFLVSLTQSIFTPAHKAELERRLAGPLDEKEFQKKTAPILDWFYLEHPAYPFMQSVGVKAKENTPVQKLFIGLPEGTNHSFFNARGEMKAVCPACCAIALFNQASNCPSFGGGFNGSLRGGAPITTLVGGSGLRKTIWTNVVTRNRLELILDSSATNTPVWVDKVRKEENVPVSSIGLLRGLFWQPAHVEIIWDDLAGSCDFCGCAVKQTATGFRKEKFKYTLLDGAKWPHPHGPRQWELKQGKREERFASFTRTAPAWTQLNTLLIRKEDGEKQGHVPAPVVSQYREYFRGERLNLIVGGYRVNKASVLERRHELFSLPKGWEEDMEEVETLIEGALLIKDELRKKVYGLGKSIGVEGIANEAEADFYNDSESLIHQVLRTLDWRDISRITKGLQDELFRISIRIFDELSSPYLHDPRMLKFAVRSRTSLTSAFNKIRGSRPVAAD